MFYCGPEHCRYCGSTGSIFIVSLCTCISIIAQEGCSSENILGQTVELLVRSGGYFSVDIIFQFSERMQSFDINSVLVSSTNNNNSASGLIV
jgi:hypothetical protein